MFITKEAFDPLIGDMSRFEAQEIAKIFAHEIAHQYWGIVVRIPSNEEQWLAESFAEYCAAMFLKDRRSEAVQRSDREALAAGRDVRGAGRARSRSPTASGSGTTRCGAPRSARGCSTTRGRSCSPRLEKELGERDVPSTFLRSLQTACGGSSARRRTSPGVLQDRHGRRTSCLSSRSTTGASRCRRTDTGRYHFATREWRNWQTRGT